MLHPTTQQLIRKLYELTSTGGLGWQPAEDNASRLETEGYVVEIAAEPPIMRLLRNDGRELERAGTEALAAVPWPGGDGTYATRIDHPPTCTRGQPGASTLRDDCACFQSSHA